MVDYQFVTERLAVGSAIETLENMKEVARDGITHASETCAAHCTP